MGQTQPCFDIPVGCSSGTASCAADSPNEFGACICDGVALKIVGPQFTHTDGIKAMAIGDNAAYWTEYVFVQGAPYSKLVVSKPIGAVGKLVDGHIDGMADKLAIRGDEVYVEADQLSVYSSDGVLVRRLNDDGTPIVDPDADGGAGGVPGAADGDSDVFANGGAGNDASRITNTPDGLLLDGQQLTSAVWTFEVTATGVYYVEKSDTGSIDFVAFEDSKNVQPIVSNLTGVQSFLVKGRDLYAVLINEDRLTWTVVYGDISVLGR